MKGAKTVKSGYIRQYKDYRELVEEDKEQIREYMKKLIKEGLTYSQVKSVVIREKGVVVSQGLF
jgi:methionine synthase II (cobalamin-independent)